MDTDAISKLNSYRKRIDDGEELNASQLARYQELAALELLAKQQGKSLMIIIFTYLLAAILTCLSVLYYLWYHFLLFDSQVF